MVKLPILYHGTDARLIEMSTTSLRSYIKDCNEVVDCLWSILKPYNDMESVETVFNGQTVYVERQKIRRYEEVLNNYSAGLCANIVGKMYMLQAREKGNGLYQYGSLYFTSFKNKAYNYAFNSFGGGEIGTTAYRMIQAVEALCLSSWKTNDNIVSAIENIKSFAESESKPVIIPIENIDINFLYEENGNMLNFSDTGMLPQDFRYTKEHIFSLENAEYLITK